MFAFYFYRKQTSGCPVSLVQVQGFHSASSFLVGVIVKFCRHRLGA
jgi:hypothetical protein